MPLASRKMIAEKRARTRVAGNASKEERELYFTLNARCVSRGGDPCTRYHHNDAGLRPLRKR
jgi:hypothetical protein